VIGWTYGTHGRKDKRAKILAGKLGGKRLFDGPGIDGRVILKRILNK
jgi:hypothetical protein